MTAPHTEHRCEKTGPIHLVSSVDEMISIYQRCLYEVKFHQYVACSSRVVDSSIENHTNGETEMESGIDERVPDQAKMEE